MSLTDEALMQAVSDGDAEKLAIIFERHSVPLFNFFGRMTADRGASEDLVQDVFFRILKYRRTWRSKGRFTTWMYHIARNTLADYFKVKGRATDRGMALTNSPIENATEKDEAATLLSRALMLLSEDDRELLILSKFQEIKYAEIGEIIGTETGTVKVRVHRAVRKLRDVYWELSRPQTICDVKKSKTKLRIL